MYYYTFDVAINTCLFDTNRLSFNLYKEPVNFNYTPIKLFKIKIKNIKRIRNFRLTTRTFLEYKKIVYYALEKNILFIPKIEDDYYVIDGFCNIGLLECDLYKESISTTIVCIKEFIPIAINYNLPILVVNNVKEFLNSSVLSNNINKDIMLEKYDLLNVRLYNFLESIKLKQKQEQDTYE